MNDLQAFVEKLRDLRDDLSVLVEAGAVGEDEAAALANELGDMLETVAKDAGLDVDELRDEDESDDDPE